jgi:hypothetical protein
MLLRPSLLILHLKGLYVKIGRIMSLVLTLCRAIVRLFGHDSGFHSPVATSPGTRYNIAVTLELQVWTRMGLMSLDQWIRRTPECKSISVHRHVKKGNWVEFQRDKT